MEKRLSAAFMPETIGVDDESHLHAGHEGARDGRGHFRVLIVSVKFIGKRMLQRHRMVYDALGEMMRNDIHALTIDAWTPDELDR
ncbi:MAG: BolA family protein [Lysobacterales bacterium]